MTDFNPSDRMVTCTRCKLVSVALRQSEMTAEIDAFNEFIDGAPENVRARYGNKRSTKDDYNCKGCGGSDFRIAELGDAPDGCTLSPVHWAHLDDVGTTHSPFVTTAWP